MQHNFVQFFQAVPDLAAMAMVETIFHDEEDEETEHLEDILDEAGYSYIGINGIAYLYKGDDIVADLDTDDYSWNGADEDFNPIAAANALIDAIQSSL